MSDPSQNPQMPAASPDARALLSFATEAAELEVAATRLLNGLQLNYDLKGLALMRDGDRSVVLSARGFTDGWTNRWETGWSDSLVGRFSSEPITEALDASGVIDAELKEAGVRMLWPMPLPANEEVVGALVLASLREELDAQVRADIQCICQEFAQWLAARREGKSGARSGTSMQRPIEGDDWVARQEALDRERNAVEPQPSESRTTNRRQFEEDWGSLPVVLLDSQGTVRHASDAMATVLGPPGKVEGVPVESLLFFSDAPRFRAAFAQARSEGSAPLASVRSGYTQSDGAPRQYLDCVLSRLEDGVLLTALSGAQYAMDAPASDKAHEAVTNEANGSIPEPAVEKTEAPATTQYGSEIERFRGRFSSQEDVLVVQLDRSGKIQHWPRGSMVLLGWSDDGVDGHDFSALLNESARSRFAKALEAGATSDEWSATLTALDGSTHPVGFRLFDLGHDGLALTLRSRLAEEASERWLRWSRALLGAMGASSLVLDPGGRIRELGAAWVRVGEKPSDWLGQHIADLLDTDRREVLSALRTAASQKKWSGTMIVAGVPAPVRLLSVRSDDGELEAFVAAQLPESVGEARDLLQRIPVGIALVGTDFRLVEANVELRALCGDGAIPKSPEGLDVREFPVFDTPELQSFWSVLEHRGTIDIPEVVLGGHPEARPVRIRGSALRDSEGKQSGYAISVLSRSGNSEADKRVAQSQKMESIGSLASELAHDFGNYVSSIMEKANAVSRRVALDQESKRYLDDVLSAARQAQHLAQELIKFAKDGHRGADALDVNRLVEEVAGLVVTSVGTKIEVAFQLRENLMPIHGDEVELQQLVLNLCLHARDVMPNGGRLHVETRPLHPEELDRIDTGEDLPGGVCLQIQDTGPGVPPEARDRIFEPFYSTNPESSNSGLGLAVAYGIVRRHGGTIEVTSEPGVGTTFQILLPGVVREARPIQSVAQKRVLVADDEPAFRELMQLVLESDGHATMLATNGREALEVLQRDLSALDLVILDLQMPEVTGLQVLDQLRTMSSELPVLLATGFATADQKAEALGRGGVRILEKPYRVNDLRNAVSDAFEEGGFGRS